MTTLDHRVTLTPTRLQGMRPLLLLCSALALIPPGAQAAAQAPSGNGATILGLVHSAEGAPVAAATVSLRRSADSVLVRGTMTTAAGRFLIGQVPAGSYLVEVSHLGYRTELRGGVIVREPAERVDLGIIRLEPRAIRLEGIQVAAVRSPIAVLADRKVYHTRDMPAAVGGTAADVLRSVPELEVSIEGSVTTRGAAPIIHINGRPPPMQGESLDAYLQQLPAEQIERVEVISNPSARYEAEGVGGIVNIVMKRGTSLGTSGNVAVSASTRHQRSGSGSLNFQEGRFSLFASGSASFFGSSSENSDLRENLTVQPATYIRQESWNRSRGGRGNADLGAELRVGSGGMLWGDVGFAHNASDAEAFTSYTHLDHLSTTTEQYDRSSRRDLGALFGSSSIGFRSVSEETNGEFSVELRRTFGDEENRNASVRYGMTPPGEALELVMDPTLAQEGQDQSGLSLDAVLVRAWGGAGQVELGYRGSSSTVGSDLRMQIESAEESGAREERVSDFANHQRIHAGFLTLSRQKGRVFLQAGIRGEHAEIRRSLPLTGEWFETRHLDLFPSAVVSTALGAAGELSLSYSKRVDRPWGVILNPAIPNLDPLNRRVGNPYLMPRYTHSLNLTVTRTGQLGVLQLSPYMRRTVNSWDQVRTVDTTGASTVTWQNLATISSYGGSFSVSLTPSGRLGGLLNLNAYREVRDAGGAMEEAPPASTQLSLISTATLRASAGLSFQGSLTYLPARQLPQGRISPMVFSTLGARLRMGGGRGAINFSVVDPFELQRFTFTTSDRTHVQTGSSTFSARRASLGLSYTFGRPPQSSRRRGQAEEGEPENRPDLR